MGLTKNAAGEQRLINHGNAVLCTDSKTFELRQVQTSNSVYVLQPRLISKAGSSPVLDLAAVAQCGSTLEAVPSTGWPHQLLKDLLPFWGEQPPLQKWTKREVFANLPFSNGELESAWVDMILFECDSYSLRPRAKTVLVLWEDILNAATAEAIPLDTNFSLNAIWRPLVEHTSIKELPWEFYSALLKRVAPAEGELARKTEDDMNLDSKLSGMMLETPC